MAVLSCGAREYLREAASAGRYEKGQGLAGTKAAGFRRVSMALIAALGLIGLIAARAAPLPEPGKKSPDILPTLTTVQQVHDLTTEEAARAYPVHLRAVVTYYDPDFGNGFAAMFICDPVGIWVNLPANRFKSLTAGTLVDVTGVSGNGLFAPVVASPHLRVIGPWHLPEHPLRLNRADL